MIEKSDSEPIMKARTSRKLYIPLYLMILILLAVILYIWVSGLSLNKIALMGVIVFGVIAFLFIEIHRLKDLYEIKPNSLVHSHGIISKKIKSVDFLAISDLDVSQNVMQRIFNFGNVNVRLFSGKESATSIKNINNPREFAEFLEETMNKKKKKGGSQQR